VIPRLYTTDEAAAICKLSPATLRTMRTRGGGPVATILGKRTVRYSERDLEEWLSGNRQERTPTPGAAA
jgi:DNA-binding transcriptional MerR regulator